MYGIIMKTRHCIALLTLFAPDINGILVNVALGKKTAQFGGEVTWPSSNAVDGKKECGSINNKYLTLSGTSDLPWWKLDLAGLFQIHQINVFGRADGQVGQLQGFRLYLSKDKNITDSNIVYRNTAKDYNNGQIIITKNLTGLFQFIKLDLPSTSRENSMDGPIVLCEVEIFVKMKNIAISKPAIMSTHYSSMVADKCVDGNARRDPNTCNCCSHSLDEINPWITIDLLQEQEIFQIHVAGRDDDSRISRVVTGLEIYANRTRNLVLGNYTSANATDVIVTTPNGIHSRYITIRRPKQQLFTEWYLVVCEVEIYIRYCKPGTYGVLCQEQCGHCRQKPCEIDSGYCPNAECLAGWTGLQCKQKDCDLGYFGLNCSSVCSTHCLNNVAQCNKTTGKCMQGCETGYMGQNCTTQCMAGQFGRDCNQTCTSNCVNGYDQCSKTTGECQQGCVAGFTGLNCSTPCETGRFGVNCSSYCSIHCYQGREKCNKSSGVCMEGCDSGYKGNNCSEVCLDGHYGRNCNRTCSGHCIGGHAQCNKSTGECVKGCVPGFTGYNCFEECPNGTFGINCVGKCQCINETVCRKTDGNCSYGCAFGWSGSNCSNDLNLIKRIHENVTTNQSSIFAPNNDPNNYNSQKAIDGVQNYALDSCHCCSVTNGDSPSWWLIDLKQKYLIGGLRIFGRESNNNEQLENAEVYAGNISTLLNPIANMTSVFTVPEMTVTRRHFTKQFEPIIAQFFLVELSKKVLTLCEFKLYVIECDIGTFGTGCMHHCHCKDKRTCNQVTGRCQTPGCLAGWQGKACENKCAIGNFGMGCLHSCHCKDRRVCNQVTGECQTAGCLAGWQGEACDIERNVLRRLDAKTYMSSMFLNWTSNLAIDGKTGPTPDVCNCCSGTQNSQLSWWKVDMGKLYPIKSVSVYSRENEQFYQQLAGFNIYFANNTGENSFHLVENYTRQIEGNKHLITFPNQLTRYIKIQRPGVLTLCEVYVTEGDCPVGTFGEECSRVCHCADQRACNKSNGICQSDACKSGWIGKSCDQVCPRNTFGDRCREKCFCADGTCTNNYGICKNGCQRGYSGFHCNQVDDTNNKTSTAATEKKLAAVIAGAVGSTIAVVVLVAIGVGFLKLRKRKSDGNKSHYSTPNFRVDQADSDYDTLDIVDGNPNRRGTAYENEVVSSM